MVRSTGVQETEPTGSQEEKTAGRFALESWGNQNPINPGASDMNSGLKMSTHSTENAGYRIQAMWE